MKRNGLTAVALAMSVVGLHSARDDVRARALRFHAEHKALREAEARAAAERAKPIIEAAEARRKRRRERNLRILARQEVDRG